MKVAHLSRKPYFSYSFDGYCEAVDYLTENYKQGEVDLNHLRGLQIVELANRLREQKKNKCEKK